MLGRVLRLEAIVSYYIVRLDGAVQGPLERPAARRLLLDGSAAGLLFDATGAGLEANPRTTPTQLSALQALAKAHAATLSGAAPAPTEKRARPLDAYLTARSPAAQEKPAVSEAPAPKAAAKTARAPKSDTAPKCSEPGCRRPRARVVSTTHPDEASLCAIHRRRATQKRADAAYYARRSDPKPAKPAAQCSEQGCRESAAPATRQTPKGLETLCREHRLRACKRAYNHRQRGAHVAATTKPTLAPKAAPAAVSSTDRPSAEVLLRGAYRVARERGQDALALSVADLLLGGGAS